MKKSGMTVFGTCVAAFVAGMVIAGCGTVNTGNWTWPPSWWPTNSVPVVDNPVVTNTPPVVTNTPPVVTNQPSASKEWPSHYAPTYFGHGYDSENEYREQAHVNCLASGTGCLKILSPVPPGGNDLAAWLLNFGQAGHWLNRTQSWYWRSRREGKVTRWIIDLGNNPSAESIQRWKFLTSNTDEIPYDKNNLQWIVNGKVQTSL